eukprot:evm.model.scf_752.7 EVM.evm.TU.scf_752.7   scf_752:49472-53356(-)
MSSASFLQAGRAALLAGKSPAAKGQAGRMMVRMAVARPSWCPGAQIPKHLNGTLPGDVGWDPLGLGEDPQALKWYVQAELVHARFAMVGVVGMLVPQILAKFGVLDVPQWYEAGQVAAQGSYAPFSVLLSMQLFLMGWAETKRWMDFKNPKSQGEPGSFVGFEAALGGTGENGYPGGVFDPLGLAKTSPTAYKDLQTKEIANGRLAMQATLGFYAQYIATGKGPVDNWLDHIADPWNNNFATNGVSVPYL